MLALGVKKGDRVGIWSPNCPEWVAVQYGTALIGAILVNINPAYRVTELEYVLRQAGVCCLVSATAAQDQRLPGHGRGGPARAARPRHVIYIGDPSWEALEEAGGLGRPGRS